MPAEPSAAILILAECRIRHRHRDPYRISSLFDDSDSEPEADPMGSIITFAEPSVPIHWYRKPPQRIGINGKSFHTLETCPWQDPCKASHLSFFMNSKKAETKNVQTIHRATPECIGRMAVYVARNGLCPSLKLTPSAVVSLASCSPERL